MKHSFALALVCFASLLQSHAFPAQLNQHGIHDGMLRDASPATFVETRESKNITCEGDDCYCTDVYDLTLILDESGSIKKNNWVTYVFPFAKNIINNLRVAADGVHVGILLFAKVNRDFVKFSDPESSDKDKLMKKINILENDYQKGLLTHILDALNYAHKEYTMDPNSRSDVSKVTVLFTDGNDSYIRDDKLSESSIVYKNTNTKLFVVGVGSSNMNALRLIGGCDAVGTDCPYVYKINWQLLPKQSEIITNDMCDTHIELPGTGTNGNLIDGGDLINEETSGEDKDNGFSTVGKISLGAGIVGLVLLAAGGAAYGYSALSGGANANSGNVEFENVENNIGVEEGVNEDFEVVDANDSMWS